MRTRIQESLAAISHEHHVRLLFACESGSRAWGFPSPDSDYDVRFIYCHPTRWYLGLDEGRDTIEFPVSELLDLGGWELRKFLRLLRASNAAALEWLQSPIIYQEDAAFRAALRPLVADCFIPKAGLHHYLGMVRKGLETDLTGEQVRLKRLFYALRAALAARWIREQVVVPPMEFAPLAEQLPLALKMQVADLLAIKAEAHEKTEIPKPHELVAFIQAEFEAGEAAREQLPPRGGNPITCLDALFQQFVFAD